MDRGYGGKHDRYSGRHSGAPERKTPDPRTEQYSDPRTEQYSDPYAGQYVDPRTEQYTDPRTGQYVDPRTEQYTDPYAGQYGDIYRQPPAPRRAADMGFAEDAAEQSRKKASERARKRFRRYTVTLLVIAALITVGVFGWALTYDGLHAGEPVPGAAESAPAADAGQPEQSGETEAAAEVTPEPEPSPEPTPEPVKTPCDAETREKLAAFADSFTDTYYGYFGTRNPDVYYGTLQWMVVDGSDLMVRILSAYYDREWVNTKYNTLSNKSFDDAYINEDGSYTVEYSLDIAEYAPYWTYETRATLKIFAVADDANGYGFRAFATE